MGLMKDFDIRIRSGGDDAAGAVNELMAELQRRLLELQVSMPRWIPVTERLPTDGVLVLAYRNRCEYGFRRDGQWIDTLYGGVLANGPTHWMPLPAPPTTNHGAVPAARASVESVVPQPTTHGDSDRTDKAAPRPSEGTGDTIARLAALEELSALDQKLELEYGLVGNPLIKAGRHTPPMQTTPGECSTPREGTFRVSRNAKATLTDAEREAVQAAVAEFSALADEHKSVTDGERAATLRGLLERLGGER